MKKGLFLSLILLINLNLFSLYRTPEAGRYYYWLFSPDLLSRSSGVVGTQNPSGVVINPASLAYIQRYKMEFSYGTAPGLFSTYQSTEESFLSGGDFFWPFIINGGVTIPSKFGNFTIYGNYMNMSNLGFSSSYNNDLGIGKVGAIYFGYSKDYSDNIAFGISGNLKFCYNPLLKEDMDPPSYFFDVAGAIDLGMVYKFDVFAPFSKDHKNQWGFQDLELAVTLKELGKPFIFFPTESEYELPWFATPFTPAFGVSFNLYNDGSTYWKFIGDFTAPFFQNFTLSIGTEVQIFKFLVLRTSYTFDFEGVLEYIDYNVTDIPNFAPYGYIYQLANVGFGLSFRFTSDMFMKQSKEESMKNKHKTTMFSIDLGGRPYHQGFIFELGCGITIGARDENPPEISFIQEDIYSSPNLDGIQDEIIIDLDIKDERYVVYWKLEIYDKNNRVVRLIESKAKRKEGMKVRDILKKFFSPKSGIPIPEYVVWDCKDNNGRLVSDGEYTFKFFAMDDNKNINEDGSAVGRVVVDTERPEIRSVIKNKIFSPNDDGNKDSLVIDIDIIKNNVENETILLNDKVELPELQSSTIKEKVDSVDVKEEKKQLWHIDILDASDTIVRSYTYDKRGKQKVEWDAKDEMGNKVPDGIYKVKLYSTDNAGNYWEEIITNIFVDTVPTPIEATILNKYFSPNDDGDNDFVNFKFKVPITKGVENWNLEILNTWGKVVKTLSGKGMPDLAMKWDGKLDSGNAPEGSYNGKLTVVYENGNMPNVLTPEFVIDVTPPQCRINLSKNIFSPNGDGKSDEVTISHSASEEDEWGGFIYDSTGKKVKSYMWKSEPPNSFYWEGKDDKNRLLDDGTYYYQVSCKDLAGNSFESEKNEVKIFTKDTPIFVTSALDSFSPNGDGIKDSQYFEIHGDISEDNKVVKWTVSVVDDSGKVIYSLKRRGKFRKKIEWPGIDKDNNLIPDGEYYAKLVVDFEAGTSSETKSKIFSCDTVAPKIELMATSTIFSPNNDGNLDIFEIMQKGSEEDKWEAYIKSSEGEVVWKKNYSGSPTKKEIWDGKDLNGNIAKNGRYSYYIKAVDKAGNTSSASIKKLEVKNVYTSAFIKLDIDKFSPNGDGKFDTIAFKPYVTEKNDLDVYKLEILDNQQNVVKLFQGKNRIPEVINWDGKDEKGNIAKDGFYTAKLSAIYDFGNTPEIESARFILDTAPPVVTVKTLPKYFSPDNDGNDDELYIYSDSSDMSGIKKWKISILEPNNKEFASFKGSGNVASKLRWDGIGYNDYLVESAEDYPVRVYAEDEAGNILDEVLDTIMVDILVIKLKDGRLKIKISNIDFKPDSAEMTDSAKNIKVLNLIAKALKKYRQYTITVEGHANKFRANLNEKRAKQLSELRGTTIVKELSRRGINSSRISVVGRGFDVPLVPLTKNASKDDLAKNRRVEFYLQK